MLLNDEQREDVDKAGLGERCESERSRSDALFRIAFPLEPVVDKKSDLGRGSFSETSTAVSLAEVDGYLTLPLILEDKDDADETVDEIPLLPYPLLR